jgi:hypothetical protein
MNDLDDLLTDAFTDEAGRAPHDPDLAGTVRRRVRRGRLIRGTATAAVAAAAVLAAGFAVLPDEHHAGSPASNPTVTVVPACESTVTRGVLPDWARTGFSDPKPVMPFVSSRSGNVVAILFADPLHSPPSPDINNKILWVWHRLPSAVPEIRMTARRNGNGPAVTAGLPSPVGPSIVDLPSTGCWRVTLTWPGGSDTLDLAVSPPGIVREVGEGGGDLLGVEQRRGEGHPDEVPGDLETEDAVQPGPEDE